MNKSIGIILERKDDGSYSINSVDIEGSNKAIWDNCIKVPLDESNFSCLRDGDNTSFLFNNSDKKYISLMLTDSLLSKLVDSYNGSNKSSEEIFNDIKEYLKKICGEVININTSSHGPCTRVIFNFPVKDDDDKKNEKKISSTDEEELGFKVDEINVADIIADIKTRMIGQNQVINDVVNNVYHNQILFNEGGDYADSKACILIDGPTGTGKTFLAKQISKQMKIPMVNRNVSSFSAPGYQGANLSEILVDLVKAAKGDLKTAERGIVVIDEFDKLCDKDGKGLEMKAAVQQELLTYLSGSKIPIEYDGKRIEFDTSKVTFICLGAFTDLRERKESELSDKDDKYRMLPEDYIKAGLMREIVGRFSLISCTNHFTKEQLREILLESKSSPLLKMVEIAKKDYHTDIVYDDDIINIIVERAYKMNTGARALTTVVNSLNTAILSELISGKYDQIQLTRDVFERADSITYRERGPQL